ncbi:MAG: hypothetical protein ACOH1T_02085 [Microbacteriaceae bacterium]
MKTQTRYLAWGASVMAVVAIAAGVALLAQEKPGTDDEIIYSSYFGEKSGGRVEKKASNECQQRLGGNGEIAGSYSSTAGEVRNLGTVINPVAGFEQGLPEKDSSFVAVCIYDIKSVSPLNQKYSYQARWAGADDRNGGSGVIAMW